MQWLQAEIMTSHSWQVRCWWNGGCGPRKLKNNLVNLLKMKTAKEESRRTEGERCASSKARNSGGFAEQVEVPVASAAFRLACWMPRSSPWVPSRSVSSGTLSSWVKVTFSKKNSGPVLTGGWSKTASIVLPYVLSDSSLANNFSSQLSERKKSLWDSSLWMK